MLLSGNAKIGIENSFCFRVRACGSGASCRVAGRPDVGHGHAVVQIPAYALGPPGPSCDVL